MTSELPSNPNLEHLSKQAKTLVKQFKLKDPNALSRVRKYYPKSTDAIKLSSAQFVIAKEYGFDSWIKLKKHVEALKKLNRSISKLSQLQENLNRNLDNSNQLQSKSLDAKSLALIEKLKKLHLSHRLMMSSLSAMRLSYKFKKLMKPSVQIWKKIILIFIYFGCIQS